MGDEEEHEEIEKKVEVGTSKEKLFMYLVGVVAFIVLVILVIVKIQNQDFPFVWFIIVGGGFIVLLAIPYIYQKVKEAINKGKGKEKSNELPEPASKEELWEIVKNVLTNGRYMNHIKEQLNVVPCTIGKNLIYDFQVLTLYSKKDCHIVINSHYPQRIPAILFNPSKPELRKTINSMSTNPEPEPDIETTTTQNPMLGTTQTTQTKIHKKNEKKKEEKEEDKELI